MHHPKRPVSPRALALPAALLLTLAPACGDNLTEGSSSETVGESDAESDSGETAASTDPGTTAQTTAGPDPSGTAGDSNTGTTDPSTTDPSTTDPGTTEPGTTDPSTTDPGTTDPSTSTTTGDPTTGDPTTGNNPACAGLGDSGLLLHTTLDDAASVATPAIGAGSGDVNTMPANDFVPALSGDGVYIDAGNEYVRFPQTVNGADNLDYARGTIDFCYQPDYDHTDGQNHAIFEARGAGNNGGFIRVRKAAGNNMNTLQVLYREPGGNGTFGELAVPANAYALVAGEWHRVTVSWDFGVAQNEQNIHVYLDGVEVISNNPSTGPASMPTPDAGEYVSIGFFAGQSWPASGVIDDFKLYDSALTP